MVIAAAILWASAEISQAIYKTQDKNWEPPVLGPLRRHVLGGILLGFRLASLKPVIDLLI